LSFPSWMHLSSVLLELGLLSVSGMMIYPLFLS
jgi:hypothetical protein